ncbi:LysR family transcriptional regulator, partial [Streptomyces xiaopingdaonensis]
MFDSRHIRTFHEVVRTGSYSAAARELGYTQPAITQQMKALERSVGTPLFVRAGRRMRLTEAGETLARHAG